MDRSMRLLAPAYPYGSPAVSVRIPRAGANAWKADTLAPVADWHPIVNTGTDSVRQIFRAALRFWHPACHISGHSRQLPKEKHPEVGRQFSSGSTARGPKTLSVRAS